jgi:two-component system chemotaxis response regulator CheB
MTRNSKRTVLRVLAADDSAVMRSILRTVFQIHAASTDSGLPPMELCGAVEDGVTCLEAVARLKPDVLLLDFEMPGLHGLDVLARLQVEAPELPVIMCSAYTERGARATLDALAHGAKDYVMKPGQQSDLASALDLLIGQLLPKIAALAGEPPVAATDKAAFAWMPQVASPLINATRVEIVVIGVSTGGPSALERMLPMLPVDLPVPVMITQHMPRLFTGALAKRLDRCCSLRVAEAYEGARVDAGTVWLAPGDAHMEVGASALRGRTIVRLHQGEALHSCKPSVDYLFRSAAKIRGGGVLALVMTGMGADGVEGAREVRDAGGTVLAQDESTSAVWGMPGRVSRAGLAAATLPLDDLAGELTRRIAVGRSPLAGAPSDGSAHFVSREGTYGLF